MNEPKGTPGRAGRVVRFLLGFALGFAISICLLELLGGGLRRSPRLARRAVCGTRLHSIGKGLMIYMAEHSRPPPDLPSVIGRDLPAPKMLVCPGTDTKPAATTQPADLASHCDYVYVAGLEESAPHPHVMVWAFELPANHGQEAANVLCADGHVACFDFDPSAGRQRRQAYLDLIQRANEHLAARRRAGP